MNKGFTTDSHGYRMICIGGRYVYEHRLVMEKKLGRKLTSADVVHHKDEDRTNNNPDNLELTTRSGHAKIHGFFTQLKHPINASDSHRWCPECQSIKPITAFWKDSKRKTGVQPLCKECFNQRRKEWRHRVGISKKYNR